MNKSIVYTKHFAERALERVDDLNKVKNIKRTVKDKMCELVFECLVYGNPRIVKAEGYRTVVYFEETKKKLYVKTIY